MNMKPPRYHRSTSDAADFSARHRPTFYLRCVLIFALSSAYLIDGTKSFAITPKSWHFKGHHIGYEEARRIDTDEPENQSSACKGNDPILLLNGFGVGSFHQHRLIPHILAADNRVVYGIDYLGQGRSWPVGCDDGNAECERGLVYSIDTWADQVISFIEDVLLPNHPCKDGRHVKIHLVGNSVGGHLSVLLALKRPDLIESICLLNATPVWGLNLPGWSAALPPPALPRRIGRYLFDRIRDISTIEKYLEAAYANRNAFDDELMKQIRGCTEGKGGHAAFASILWSAPATFPSELSNDYNSNLANLECDVLLVFGKNDPWCKPAFAAKMMAALAERKHPGRVQRYIELDNVGHCPNHEAPQAVAKALTKWIANKDKSKENLSLVEGDTELLHEPWGDIAMREVDANAMQISFLDKIVARLV